MVAIQAIKCINVLVVDDDRSMRHLVRHVLKSHQDLAIIAEAVDGHDAIERALTHDPEVVIMDIEMPHVDGFAATQQIRAARPNTRVIIFSCCTSQEDCDRAFTAGAAGFVGKHAVAELPAAIRAVHDGRLYFAL